MYIYVCVCVCGVVTVGFIIYTVIERNLMNMTTQYGSTNFYYTFFYKPNISCTECGSQNVNQRMRFERASLMQEEP